jgi:hypothetical protein
MPRPDGLAGHEPRAQLAEAGEVRVWAPGVYVEYWHPAGRRRGRVIVGEIAILPLRGDDVLRGRGHLGEDARLALRVVGRQEVP